MPERPNVVVVTTDQQRADACAREGFPLDTTPCLDRLARAGTWFDRAYTSTPVCAPARTSLLTGRFPTATSVWVNQQSDAARYDRDLFDVFGDAGYRTALVGKNHSHLSPESADYWAEYGHWGAQSEASRDFRTPEAAAFEEWLAELALFNDGGGFSLDPTPFPVETQCAHRCVSQAREWIESLDGDDPFFAWLSIPEPHNPYQVPEPYFSLFPPEDLPSVAVDESALDDRRFKWRWLREIGVARAADQLEAAEGGAGSDATRERTAGQEAPDVDYESVLPRLRANYYGMLRMVDDQVERFVSFLEDAGLRENTLLVFLSDHGDFVGDYGLMRKGVGLPEATTRIPLFFHGPGVESRGAAHDAHVSIVDVLPTLCDAVDVPVPDGVQGRSLWPVLTGESDGEALDSVYAECGYGGRHSSPDLVPDVEDANKNELNAHTQTGRTAMVRRGRWKLVYDARDGPALYDLEADPMETTDLSAGAERVADRRETAGGRGGSDATRELRGRPQGGRGQSERGRRTREHAVVLRDLLSALASWSLRVRDTLPETFPVDRSAGAPGESNTD